MRRPTSIKSLIAFLLLSLSLLVFVLLQNPDIYESTLGKISYNYAHKGVGKKVEVVPEKEPFQEIGPSNIYTWDALLYKAIIDSAYVGPKSNFTEKLAYYPLFSYVWAASTIDSNLIFLFNYLLFIVGLVLLSDLLSENTVSSFFVFAVGLLLPAMVTYYLPYAESLFLLTFAVAVWGLFKQKYWLFFIGAFAFSMTRPAVLIFLCALVASDTIHYYVHRQIKYYLRELFFKMLPFLLGFFVVTYIQYYYTGNWFAYFDAMTYFWPTESGLFNTITDWSLQGFGMTVFAIFFVALPCLVYAVVWGIKLLKKGNPSPPPSLFKGDKVWIKEYLFITSVLFIGGNLMYTFLTSGDALNGFYRYTMNIPFFYIVLFLLPEKIKEIPLKNKFIYIGCSSLLMIIFLASVNYGGSRFQFPYSGLYLSLLVFFYYIAEPYLSVRNKVITILLLLIPCIVWHTYLFNMYLSDAWIFT